MPTVKVTLTATTTGGKKGVTISVDPFKLDLTGEVNEELDIDWDLDVSNAPGWAFAAQGIDIKGHGNKFEDKQMPSANKYRWKRKHREGGPKKDYKYAINAVNAAEGTTLTLDPFIVND